MVKKGFALVKDKEDKLIKDIRNLSIQDKVNIRFFNGEVNADIKKIKKHK